MDTLEALQSLGVALPTPAYLVGIVVFGLAGTVAWWSGRQARRPRRKWLGVALMLYPSVVDSTAWLYAIGLALCVAWWWEQRG